MKQTDQFRVAIYRMEKIYVISIILYIKSIINLFSFQMKSCEKSVIVVGNKQEPKPCTQSRNKDKSSIKQRLIGQTWKSDVYKLNKYALLVMLC